MGRDDGVEGQVSEAHVLRKPGERLRWTANFGASTRVQAKLESKFFWVGLRRRLNLYMRRMAALGIESWRTGSGRWFDN